MTRAYEEYYLSKTMRTLGEMFDFAVHDAGWEGEAFAAMFAGSSIAQRLERGEPACLVGMSGIELAAEVVEESTGERCDTFPRAEYGRSVEFWCGTVLCYYQWLTLLPYSRIFQIVSFRELRNLYDPYHEADIRTIANVLNEYYQTRFSETNLKRIRTAYGCSQSELAKASGVSLRSIQMYEQRNKDINKSQAKTLRSLSRVLGCRMEDLMEVEGF